jgi:Tfp pilus assembly protein FimT
MTDQASARSQNSGFSMIELCIVLTGAALLAAFALPSIKNVMNHYNIVFAAQEISTQMHSAKLKAISGNETYRVNFPSANSSKYQVELSDGTLLQGPFYLPSGIQPYTAGGSQAVTFPGNYVLFQPDGSVPLSGNGSIGRVKLVSNNGLRVDVLVDRGGMIRHTPPYTGSTPPF